MPDRMDKAMIELLLSLMVAFVDPAGAQGGCRVPSHEGSAQLHWSGVQLIELPGCVFSLRAEPDPQDSDKGVMVFLVNIENSSREYLFSVQRDGAIYWDSGAKRLVYQDRIDVGQYRLMLFNRMNKSSLQYDPLKINTNILDSIKRSLKSNESLERYWPNFVSWNSNTVTISVGYATSTSNVTKFTPHCVGYVISTDNARIVKSIGEIEFKKQFSGACPELED